MGEDSKTNESGFFDLPLIVEVLPGTANKGYLLAIKNGYDRSVESILNEAVEATPKNREMKSIQDILKTEYTSTSKVTINGADANKTDDLKKHANSMEQDETPSQQKYNLLKIRIVKPQEGGLDKYLKYLA